MSEEEEQGRGLTGELELLRVQLDLAGQEKEQFRNLLQRVQADAVNLKRRMEEEREGLQQRANAELLLRLLPVLDDYGRAFQHVPVDVAIGSWAAGVDMVYRNFLGVLESMGVTRMAPEGSVFDPLEHESVSYEERDDQEDDTVVMVVRDGYMLHGKVLRPAQVVVSRKHTKEST